MLNLLLTKITPIALALNYTAIDENAILTTIVNWLCALIAIIGIVYGGWEAFQGMIDESPSKRKHGLTVLFIGISIAGVIYGIMKMILTT